jgi:ABC-type amino acid transport substrate-binding protein
MTEMYQSGELKKILGAWFTPIHLSF